jgi:hypothetical protein
MACGLSVQSQQHNVHLKGICMSNAASPLIDGFSVGGYRSFGQPQRIGPLSRVNVFIGPNNAGKSNILRFVAEHLEWLSGAKGNSSPSSKLQRELDQHRGQPHPTVAGIGWAFNSTRITEFRSRTQNRVALELFDRLIRQPEISHETELVWCERSTRDLGASLQLPLGSDQAVNELFAKTQHTGHDIDVCLQR